MDITLALHTSVNDEGVKSQFPSYLHCARDISQWWRV